MGLEALESASCLAGDLLCVRFTASGPGEFGQCSLGFGDAHFPALSVAFFAPGASGDHIPLALMLN